MDFAPEYSNFRTNCFEIIKWSDELRFFLYSNVREGCPKISGEKLLSESSGGARGVMVIVVGNGHGDTSSNPGRDKLHFT